MELIDIGILNKIKSSIFGIAELIKEDQNDSYNIIINNWKIIERLFLDFDNKYCWPMSINTFSSKFDLNKNKVNSQMRRWQIRGILIEGHDYTIEHEGGQGWRTTYIHEQGAKKVLERMQSIQGAKYLNELGINIHLKKCFLYICIIKYAVRGIDNPKIEYTIRNPDYRIDLYLEQHKLAIECDELGHEHEIPLLRYNREELSKLEIFFNQYLHMVCYVRYIRISNFGKSKISGSIDM